jgi:hypothetical protein
MSFIKTIYQSFQPLLFGAGEQIGLLSILKFCSISIGLFLLLDGLSKVRFTHLPINPFNFFFSLLKLERKTLQPNQEKWSQSGSK